MVAGPLALGAAPVRAQDGLPRVAVIVGPVGSLTEEYRTIARAAAAEARRWTSDVVTVYSPNATWPAVKAAISGASVVIYLGHGNGWPSPHRSSLFEGTQDGFGLNPVAGAGDDAHQYFGAAYIRREVNLAPGAIVLLHRLCYASGNSEPGVPEGTITMARERVDNFASGFLDAGAGAVIADAFATPASYLRQLLGRGTPAITAWRNSPTANGNVFSFASVRTTGAVAYMDPDRQESGFYRSIVLAARTAQTTGPGGPGTGEGTSVPSAMAPTIVLPVDPPQPSLAALGAVVEAPILSGRPIAAAATSVSIPLRLPTGATLPTGLQVGVRWTPIDLAPTIAAPAGSPSPSGAPSPSGSLAPRSTPGASSSAPTSSASPPASTPGSSAVPTPTSSAVPTPGASAGPSPSAAPNPSTVPWPGTSPDPGTTPYPSSTPDPMADILAGAAQVVPEQASTAVDVTPATVVAGTLQAPLQMPSAPGRYRLVLTLHGADGVALDAETQALVPALIVRVAGPIDVSFNAPVRAEALPGSAMGLLLTVTNAGTLSWAGSPVTRPSAGGYVAGGDPSGIGGRPVLVGRWLPLDEAGTVADATTGETPFDAAPGTSAVVTLSLRAPATPGTYLVVLDVRSPVYGSLAARGAATATVIVTVGDPAR
jgi:hypothetical protein